METYRAFFRENGINHQMSEDGQYISADVAMFYSPPIDGTLTKKYYYKQDQIVKRHYQNNERCLFVENGFLNRTDYSSLSWDYTVGFGVYHIPKQLFPHRLNALNLTLHPPHINPDGIIMVCGQIQTDTQLQHLSYKKWLRTTIGTLKKHTTREIIYRHHPKASRSQKAQVDKWIARYRIKLSVQEKMVDEFPTIRTLVALNSNGLLDGIISGIPVIGMDPGSVVYPYIEHDLSNVEVVKPISEKKRLEALMKVSYMQWNKEEIKNGQAWDWIMNSYDAPHSPVLYDSRFPIGLQDKNI